MAAGFTALGHALGEMASEGERAVEHVRADSAAVADTPLPVSGNVVGLLHILLKTELECGTLAGLSHDEQARIVENYQRIDTHARAQAYVESVAARIEAARNAGRGV